MSFWTEEKIAVARSLNKAGLSAGRIGAKIGCSRHAVIGRFLRDGVALSGSDGRWKAAASKTEKISPQKKHLLISKPPDLTDIPKNAEPESLRLSFMEINDTTCRWPHGEPSDLASFHFCGHPVKPESVYCEPHDRRAHNHAATVAVRAAAEDKTKRRAA